MHNRLTNVVIFMMGCGVVVPMQGAGSAPISRSGVLPALPMRPVPPSLGLTAVKHLVVQPRLPTPSGSATPTTVTSTPSSTTLGSISSSGSSHSPSSPPTPPTPPDSTGLDPGMMLPPPNPPVGEGSGGKSTMSKKGQHNRFSSLGVSEWHTKHVNMRVTVEKDKAKILRGLTADGKEILKCWEGAQGYVFSLDDGQTWETEEAILEEWNTSTARVLPASQSAITASAACAAVLLTRTSNGAREVQENSAANGASAPALIALVVEATDLPSSTVQAFPSQSAAAVAVVSATATQTISNGAHQNSARVALASTSSGPVAPVAKALQISTQIRPAIDYSSAPSTEIGCWQQWSLATTCCKPCGSQPYCSCCFIDCEKLANPYAVRPAEVQMTRAS